MLVIPAIDIKDGKCVRLVQGSRYAATEYYDDPLDAARRWAEYPVKRLHVVDLDGAFGGAPVNYQKILRITGFLAAKGIEIEVGGGIRERQAVSQYLENGASRVILGTMAVKQRALFSEIVQSFPSRINLALDCRQGYLAVAGWKERTGLKAAKLLDELKALPLGEVIYTEVSRDGTLGGADVRNLRRVMSISRWPVIASGGVAGVRDVEEAAAAGAYGIIIGKALYDSRLDLTAAIAAAQDR